MSHNPIALFILCFDLWALLQNSRESIVVLMRALRQLEQKGKAAIFKGTSADDEGVKFSV